MKYYKVTQDNLKSARASIDEDGNRCDGVQYKLDEWVKPYYKKSKLFVFADLSAAKRFSSMIIYCDNEKNDRIFECEVKNPTGAKTMSKYGMGLALFWDDKLHPRDIGIAPSYTYFADEVKLIKEII